MIWTLYNIKKLIESCQVMKIPSGKIKRTMLIHLIQRNPGQNVDGQNVDGQNVDNFGNIGQNHDGEKNINTKYYCHSYFITGCPLQINSQ